MILDTHRLGQFPTLTTGIFYNGQWPIYRLRICKCRNGCLWSIQSQMRHLYHTLAPKAQGNIREDGGNGKEKFKEPALWEICYETKSSEHSRKLYS